MKYLLLSILLFLASNIYAQSSTEEELAIQKTIENLFDGMRAGDSTKVHSVFRKELRLFSVFTNRKGVQQIEEGSLNEFLKAVATPHDAIWDERINEIKIQVDDRLAQAWIAYHFYLGDQFSHCGVNAVQLVKEAGVWKIIHLVDTRRTKNCVPID